MHDASIGIQSRVNKVNILNVIPRRSIYQAIFRNRRKYNSGRFVKLILGERIPKHSNLYCVKMCKINLKTFELAEILFLSII